MSASLYSGLPRSLQPLQRKRHWIGMTHNVDKQIQEPMCIVETRIDNFQLSRFEILRLCSHHNTSSRKHLHFMKLLTFFNDLKWNKTEANSTSDHVTRMKRLKKRVADSTSRCSIRCFVSYVHLILPEDHTFVVRKTCLGLSDDSLRPSYIHSSFNVHIFCANKTFEQKMFLNIQWLCSWNRCPRNNRNQTDLNSRNE